MYSNSSSASGSWLLIILGIGLIVLAFAIIGGAIQGIKQGKQKAEKDRREKEELLRLNALESERRQKQAIEQQRKNLERERAKHRIDLNFIKFDENCIWDNLPENEQENRLNRAYEQRDMIKIDAYDTRYKIAKICGTTYNRYLTSSEFCTCQDFRKRRLPCKHMYFLADKVIEDNLEFTELDYENGLLGFSAILVGRFPGGSSEAIKALQEHGCIMHDADEPFRNISFAILGESKAIKKIENLNAAGIPIIRYRDALKLFTSEIRHPELEDEADN